MSQRRNPAKSGRTGAVQVGACLTRMENPSLQMDAWSRALPHVRSVT